jgi:hypothetical protein
MSAPVYYVVNGDRPQLTPVTFTEAEAHRAVHGGDVILHPAVVARVRAVHRILNRNGLIRLGIDPDDD